jgi:phage tail-like protein
MALSNGDSVAVHNFAIQIDGIQVEYLKSVGSITQKQDVIEGVQNTPSGKPKVSKMPGISKGGEVTLTRGGTTSASFTTWIQDSLNGDMTTARKSASIIVMDYMNNVVQRFNVTNAWISDRNYTSLTSGEAAMFEETVTIVFEDMTVEYS